MNSEFQVLDSGFFVNGIWISEFLSLIRIPEPKISGYACKTFVDSRLNKQKPPGFRLNPDYLKKRPNDSAKL